ncbi:MAG: protein kinase [Pirellulales bacterium]|nr:protein kinase [Pirellulales bacterium]
MKEGPPRELVDLLGQLGLASDDDFEAVGRRARRLARGLPLFGSVWVDALAQARRITPLQAAMLNAGEGGRLRVGPFLLRRKLPSMTLAECFEARHEQTKRTIRLAVVQRSGEWADGMAAGFEKLVADGRALKEIQELAPAEEVGVEGDRAWVACRWIDGPTAAERLVRNGRFPPEAVLEIARRMMPGLVALEEAGLVHGDIRAETLVLNRSEGGVVLPLPGFRAVLRPSEGFALADLAPEGFDGLAPERIRDGTPADTTSDLYSCGCLWWHLLTGRSPLAGGDGLTKLRSAQLRSTQSASIGDVRGLAPEVPEVLAETIARCVRPDPSDRPESMAALAAALGAPTRRGRAAVTGCLGRRSKEQPIWDVTLRTERMARRLPGWLAFTACCLLAIGAVAWSVWHGGVPVRSAQREIEKNTTGQAGGGGGEEPQPNGARAGKPPMAPEPSASPETLIAPETLKGPADRGPTVELDKPPPSVGPTTVGEVHHEEPARDLVLSAEKLVDVRVFDRLRPGQRVRPEGTARPVVRIPRGGLVVRVPEAHFENLDFVWEASAGPSTTTLDSPNESPALVRLEASSATWKGCTFAARGSKPTAIVWIHPADRTAATGGLPSGKVIFENCFFCPSVGTAVECRTLGALGLSLRNVLHLGEGPLVELDHAPAPAEPVFLKLDRTTLRGSGPLLVCRDTSTGPAGRITIETIDSALVPGEASTLLAFSGKASPLPWLSQIRWTGQGSLVGYDVPIARWTREDGSAEPLDDTGISIEGLTRSETTFAGPVGPDPATSRLTQWQVPSRSPDPPGIDPTRLPRQIN